MFSGKNQASQRPTAFGSMLQASTYGMAIPEIYGLIQSPLLAIWANNLRQGGSTKKFKQMKKGITAYCENIDFLLGKNPILGVMQMWNNGGKLPLTFTKFQQTVTAPGPASITVSDSHFYAVVGVTLTQDYSQAVNDYGGSGAATLSGAYEVPLWNRAFAGSDPTDSHDYRNFPFLYRWIPSDGATVYFDQWPYGPMGSGTLTIYYAQLMAATSYHPPAAKLRLAFESILGSGDEYAGYSAQQIQYPWYAGMGSPDIDLGSAGAIPAIKAEVQGKWGIYPSGDCDYVDIIEDICKSGIAQASLGGNLNFGTVQHGCGAYDFPGPIQKKMATGNSGGLPAIAYDLPNTAGNILVAIASGSTAPSISSSNGETWTPVIPGSGGTQQMWYATAAGGNNTVTIAGAGASATALIMEIGGAGSADQTTATFLGVVSNASGSLLKNVSSSLGPYQCASLWNNFSLIAPLPADAVIKGIYPVMKAAVTVSTCVAGLTYGNNLNLDIYATGTMGGNGFAYPAGRGTSFASTELWSDSIGTDLSALNGLEMGAELKASLNSNFGNDTIGVSACGFAVLYSSATAPGGTPPIANPFTPPAGQYFGWALPGGAQGSGTQTMHPFASGTNGTQSATEAAAAWTPSSSSTQVVSVSSTGAFTAAAASANTGDGSVASTTSPGSPSFLLAAPFYGSGAPAGAAVAKWNALTEANIFGNSPTTFQAHGRVVKNPGSYAYVAPGSATMLAMLAIKPSQPPTYPNPLGGFIDPVTREQTRAQCRAAGLWGSLSMSSQQAASNWIGQLAQAANCAPAFSGFRLKLIPRSEASAAGNGAVYIAPTASGPVADLDADNGDFFAGPGEPAIKCTRKARIDTDTVLQMQHLSRSSDYQQVVTAVPDPAGIARYGTRKKDPETNNAVVDVSVARSILGIEVRRRNYVEQVGYSFTLNARWGYLEAMDLITITDRAQGIVKVPVRLTSVEENDSYALSCEAEPFVYGVHAPQAIVATAPSPYSGSDAVSETAGNVNAPIIFEAVPRLYGNAAQAQLWLVISSSAANYGGCQVYASTDSGSSYNPIGDPLTGGAVTGSLTADWPAHADPDTVNDLPVDLTESKGALDSYAVSDEDNFVYPCYVEGQQLAVKMNGVVIAQPDYEGLMNGTLIWAAVGYELMTYASAVLTATNKYTLKATGSGNKLRRAAFDAPAVGQGCDHPSGKRWAFLSPSGIGILKVGMDSVWVGKELFFKICSFNSFGAAAQSLADVPAYTYVPSGVPATVT